MRDVTYALLRPETALAAVEALRGATDKAAVEGLVELLYARHTARAAVAAIDALDGCPDAFVLDALHHSLESEHASVRAASIAALQRRTDARTEEALTHVLERDPSWTVRRPALAVLAAGPAPGRWQVLGAATDPHWRVRHALIQALLRWGQTQEERQEIDERLARTEPNARVRGVRAYLRYRWSGQPLAFGPYPPVAEPVHAWPWWDWDAAVLLRNLERLGAAGRRQELALLPPLLAHLDSRVRGLAVETLRDWGEPRHLAQVVALLDDPRNGAGEAVARLLSAIDLDRIEETARLLVHDSGSSPAQRAWALDQAGAALPLEAEEPTLRGIMTDAPAQPIVVRCALARLAARWPHADAEGWLRNFLVDAEADVQWQALRGLNQAGTAPETGTLRCLLESSHAGVRAEAVQASVADGDGGLLEVAVGDRDAGVRVRLAECLNRSGLPFRARLQSDPHPHVRAAALTPTLAAELVKEPARETSWHVLATAARMARVPLWELEPKPLWRSEALPATAAPPLRPHRAAPPHARTLGSEGLVVSPVAISGHYGLPVEGFVRAVEAGVNLLFWEPNYHTLIEFATRLPAAERNALHFIAGTFEADGKRIRRDAERALRLLKIDRLAIFLIFWVQSWDRITLDVREALEELRSESKIATFALSTHSRSLAVEALAAGWNPVMVRHSAAHRGAEERVLPRAVELGTSIITFNNTCYGRLLRPHGEAPAPSAADCYRYTLAQPGVTVCLSAPATLTQLEENLTVLHDPTLPEERRRALQRHGDAVYQEDATFRKYVRAL